MILTTKRLYWSCDPDDFQKNTNENVLNQGVVRMNLSTNGSNKFFKIQDYFLRY